jgi:hypothetical protein
MYSELTPPICNLVTLHFIQHMVAQPMAMLHQLHLEFCKFWQFVKTLYLHSDSKEVTITTDQDKGSDKVIEHVLPNVVNFQCSWHLRNNLIKVSPSIPATAFHNQLHLLMCTLHYQQCGGGKQLIKLCGCSTY